MTQALYAHMNKKKKNSTWSSQEQEQAKLVGVQKARRGPGLSVPGTQLVKTLSQE
jgi:hypothetical protein